MTARMTEEQALRMIPPEELEKAKQFFKEFHWGHAPDKLFRINQYTTPKSVTGLGYLRFLGYQTSKKGDGKDIFYVHSFQPNVHAKDGMMFPMLACDPKGKQLIIVGHNYRITDRGIVG